jgi:hypothetical protein
MNQGMVASVIGKFTNTSAHTSYLFLVKEHFSTIAFRNRPRTSKTARLNPFGSPRRKIRFQNLSPLLVGPAIIYDSQFTVNVQPESIRNQLWLAVSPADESAGRSAHYRA